MELTSTTSQHDLVVNVLTKPIYNELCARGQLQDEQLYVIEDNDGFDAEGLPIRNVPDPIDLSDAVNKTYVDQLTDGISSVCSQDIHRLSDEIAGKITIDDKTAQNLELRHVSITEYAEILTAGALSNCVYVISGDSHSAYNQQIKDVADPTDQSDAVTKGYMESHTISAHQSLSQYAKTQDVTASVNALSAKYVPFNILDNATINSNRKLSITNGSGVTELNGGYWNIKGADNGINFERGTYNTFESGSYAEFSTGSYIKLDGKLCCAYNNIVDSQGKGLADWLNQKVPTTRKINGHELTGDIDIDIVSLSVDSTKTDELQLQHISKEEYIELLKNGQTLSNVVYVVSSDTESMYDQRVTDVADPQEDNDAATKGYVDSSVTTHDHIFKRETIYDKTDFFSMWWGDLDHDLVFMKIDDNIYRSNKIVYYYDGVAHFESIEDFIDDEARINSMMTKYENDNCILEIRKLTQEEAQAYGENAGWYWYDTDKAFRNFSDRGSGLDFDFGGPITFYDVDDLKNHPETKFDYSDDWGIKHQIKLIQEVNRYEDTNQIQRLSGFRTTVLSGMTKDNEQFSFEILVR